MMLFAYMTMYWVTPRRAGPIPDVDHWHQVSQRRVLSESCVWPERTMDHDRRYDRLLSVRA